MEIAGIPLHPLVVHAVVVLAPLSAVLAIAYALRPSWRWLLRWPLVLLTVATLGSAVVAAMSGESLLESREGLEQLPAVQTHQERGELLRNLVIAFTVVVGLGAWRLGGPSSLKSERGERPQRGGAADIVVMGLMVLVGVGVLVGVFLAGHSGAEAVWGGG